MIKLLLWAKVRTYDIGIGNVVLQYAIQNNTSIDTIYTNGESMAEWLITEYNYLVSIGYIRRGNTMKTMVQHDLIDEHTQAFVC